MNSNYSAVRLPTAASAETFLARRKKFPAGTYGSFFKNLEPEVQGVVL